LKLVLFLRIPPSEPFVVLSVAMNEFAALSSIHA
jgi:hypothetical protein